MWTISLELPSYESYKKLHHIFKYAWEKLCYRVTQNFFWMKILSLSSLISLFSSQGLFATCPLAFVLPSILYMKAHSSKLFSRENLSPLLVLLFSAVAFLTGLVTMITSYNQVSTCVTDDQMDYCYVLVNGSMVPLTFSFNRLTPLPYSYNGHWNILCIFVKFSNLRECLYYHQMFVQMGSFILNKYLGQMSIYRDINVNWTR